MRPNTDKGSQLQATNNMTGLKENTHATNMMGDSTNNGTLSFGGNMKKGLVYFDSEKVKSLLAVDEDNVTPTTNPPKQQETYQGTYNPKALGTNNNTNIPSKMSPVDLHNTNIIQSKEWGNVVNFSNTGASNLPILPNRKPQIGGLNTMGGKNVRQRVNVGGGGGNSYVDLLYSTIRNQQIV